MASPGLPRHGVGCLNQQPRGLIQTKQFSLTGRTGQRFQRNRVVETLQYIRIRTGSQSIDQHRHRRCQLVGEVCYLPVLFVGTVVFPALFELPELGNSGSP